MSFTMAVMMSTSRSDAFCVFWLALATVALREAAALRCGFAETAERGFFAATGLAVLAGCDTADSAGTSAAACGVAALSSGPLACAGGVCCMSAGPSVADGAGSDSVGDGTATVGGATCSPKAADATAGTAADRGAASLLMLCGGASGWPCRSRTSAAPAQAATASAGSKRQRRPLTASATCAPGSRSLRMLRLVSDAAVWPLATSCGALPAMRFE